MMIVFTIHDTLAMHGSRGGDKGRQRVRTPPPLKITKNIGFHSNTGLGPLKITKLQSQNSMPASETQFKKRCQSWTPLTKLSGSAHVSNLDSNDNKFASVE